MASALPCKSSSLKGEVETVQSAKMAGRVPGVTVSVEAVQMEIAEKKKSPSPLLEAVMAGRSISANFGEISCKMHRCSVTLDIIVKHGQPPKHRN